jgi:hypothetical protein
MKRRCGAREHIDWIIDDNQQNTTVVWKITKKTVQNFEVKVEERKATHETITTK